MRTPITTRRTAVRTAAWAAPAIAVAATAPPASAASGGTLELGLGTTHVDLFAYAGLVIQGLWVRAHGSAIAPNQLVLTVTFAPTPPLTANLLTSPYGFTLNGWGVSLVPGSTPATAVPVVYTRSVADGQLLAGPFMPGAEIFTAAGGLDQLGSFLITASAPGYQSTSGVVPVPRYRMLMTPGNSRVVVSPQTGRAQLVLDGLTIATDPPNGGFVPQYLTVTVSFVPAAPGTASTLDAIQAPSGVWGYDATAKDVTTISFTNLDVVHDGPNGVSLFPDGIFVETHGLARDQPGSFVVTLNSYYFNNYGWLPGTLSFPVP